MSATSEMSVRVAVIDSGVNPTHPHVQGVAGGVSFNGADYLDRLGHGTAVTAVIREKAPGAEIYAVKVFDRDLVTRIELLLEALDWCARERMHLVNLSLGTANREHEAVLREALQRRREMMVVAAREMLPGSLPGVLGVSLDWDCPRHEYRVRPLRASGYPREIPGVPPERNLRGVSFAVANVTGFAARAWEERAGKKACPTGADELLAILCDTL